MFLERLNGSPEPEKSQTQNRRLWRCPKSVFLSSCRCLIASLLSARKNLGRIVISLVRVQHTRSANYWHIVSPSLSVSLLRFRLSLAESCDKGTQKTFTYFFSHFGRVVVPIYESGERTSPRVLISPRNSFFILGFARGLEAAASIVEICLWHKLQRFDCSPASGSTR